ncbi:hypothetical protein NW752_008539 [Fusarium irregulare]|uniref:Uncharacterized protein n=1 Tax=Fusarium irregulare TaxID=2494466 RepID=A0A9W8UE38_9HYPO|nr:hypothetical protein NW752_008539 [Fusarium irregulare]KAJ4020467.1 hypothetical protein NW766_001954 [Fusarium irregulare]
MDSALFDDVEDYPEPQPSFPAERSAEMPMLWDENHCRLIDSCARTESLYELYLQLPRLAADLEDNQILKDNDFPVVNTVQALKDFDWSMLELLHSMDHGVVESIVKNTFAFDVTMENISCFRMPQSSNPEVPGVYVVGLSILGRNGRFLDFKEMERLIQDINRYISGYEAYAKFKADEAQQGYSYAKTNQSKDEQRADAFWKRVDSFAGGNATAEPAFIKKDEEIPSIKALLKTFENMCDRSLDPAGTTRMLQSPLYVGCSKNLFERTKIYTRDSLRGMNKPMALTICILRMHKVKVDVCVGNVLRVWKEDQLPKAEQLVATLAGSLVYQHGFNATEAGGTGSRTLVDEDGLRANVAHIFSGTRLLLTNLRSSVQEGDLRHRFLRDIDRVNAQLQEVYKAFNEAVAFFESLPPNFEWTENLTAMEEVLRTLQKQAEEKEQAVRFWLLMIKIQNIWIEETGHALPLLGDGN